MGIQCQVILDDLPENMHVKFSWSWNEDQDFKFFYATLISPLDGSEMIFDRYEDWLSIDCNHWGNNRGRYLPWLDRHGIKYLLS